MNKTISCFGCGVELYKVYHNTRYCTDCKTTKFKEIQSRAHKLRKYNITEENEYKLLLTQDFKCGICCDPIGKDGKKYHIDHNHKTNYIRGLLCFNCNVGLGNFFDDKNRLERAIVYLTLTDEEL